MKIGTRMVSINLVLVLLLGLATPVLAAGEETPIPVETPPSASETLPQTEENTPSEEMLPVEELPVPDNEATMEQKTGIEQQAVDSTLYIDGNRIYPDTYMDTFWFYLDMDGVGNLYLMDGFSCRNIKASGSLQISVSGTATINVYSYFGPAIQTGGALDITTYSGSILNIYSRATATNINSGITAGGAVSIKSDYSEISIVAQYSSSDPSAKPPGIRASGAVTVTGVGSEISSQGEPAILSNGFGYDQTAFQTMVGTGSATAVKGNYTNQKYLRVEPRDITLYLDGNGGQTSNGATNLSWVYGYGAYAGTSGFPTFEKSGNRLIGWSTFQDGKGDVGTWFAAKEDLVPILTGDNFITLYAQWAPKSGNYDALFDAWGCNFEDGRGAKLICTEYGKQLTMPQLNVVGATLLGWQEHPALLGEKTKWYFPGVSISPAAGLSFYATWAYGNETYWEYNGGGGVSASGTDKLYQTIRATTTDLVLYSDTAFTRKDGRPFGGWNTESDWSGDVFAAGERVAIDLSVGKVPLYAMWGVNTQSALALRSTSIPYTGKIVDLAGNATTTVMQGSNVIKNPNVIYEYYDQYGNALSEAPIRVGDYRVRAHYIGDQALGYLPSVTATKNFSITKITAQIVVPLKTQTVLWTGGAVDFQAPTVTLNGVPTSIQVDCRYKKGTGWYTGVPTELGTYDMYAVLSATDGYDAVYSEHFTLTISNFVAGSNVRGNVDVPVKAQKAGTCIAVVALYRADTNRLLAVTEKSVNLSLGNNKVSLQDVTLNAAAAPGDIIKIIFVDNAKGFRPVTTQGVSYTVA